MGEKVSDWNRVIKHYPLKPEDKYTHTNRRSPFRLPLLFLQAAAHPPTTLTLMVGCCIATPHLSTEDHVVLIHLRRPSPPCLGCLAGGTIVSCRVVMSPVAVVVPPVALPPIAIVVSPVAAVVPPVVLLPLAVVAPPVIVPPLAIVVLPVTLLPLAIIVPPVSVLPLIVVVPPVAVLPLVDAIPPNGSICRQHAFANLCQPLL